MRKVSMKKVREVIELHCKMKLSVRKIEGATGVARSTVSDYINRFKKVGLSLEELNSLDDNALENKLFNKNSNRVETTTTTTTTTKPLPDFNYIHEELKRKRKTKVTLYLLWQEYKQDNPNGYQYTQFRVLYNRYKQKLNPSMRQVHIAGEKMFVDYSGTTIPIYDQKTGEVRKAQIFVATLGASNYTYVEATFTQGQEDFINSHIRCYEFFNGTPKIVVPDNLKSAVIYNNKEGIKINESYADLNRHYGVIVSPTRVRKPKDKAKVEKSVQAIQMYIVARLRNIKFFSLDELNKAIFELLDDFNNKVIKRLQKSRIELFNELDKPELNPLPTHKYIYKEFKRAKVNQDYHIELLKCYYSVPFSFIGEVVETRYSTATVSIYHNNKLIATHPRLRRVGDNSTLIEHMPKEHQYVNEKMNPDRLYSWAKSIGNEAYLFVDTIFQRVEYPPLGYKKIVAVLSLAKKYGNKELNLALGYALINSILTVKSIKSILNKKLYLSNQEDKKDSNTTQSVNILNNHSNIRGANEYK